MWVFVIYDLPTDSARERRIAARFRRRVMGDGFSMLQFSIYIRHCLTDENARTHMRRVEKILPEKGKVALFSVTDTKFSEMRLFEDRARREPYEPYGQTVMF